MLVDLGMDLIVGSTMSERGSHQGTYLRVLYVCGTRYDIRLHLASKEAPTLEKFMVMNSYLVDK
jgi:hypothetical protein